MHKQQSSPKHFDLMSVALPALTMAGAKAGAAQGIQWGLDDLLQELLMALVGYTGDIFVDNSNDDPSCTEVVSPEHCTIDLAPDVVLADDVSREEVLRLLQLGFHFKQIKKFMQQEQYPADGHKSKYRCALCSGLDEVLCLYEDEVVLLQDRLLHQGLDKKGLPGITYELADLQRLLSHLHFMVYALRRRNSLTLQAEDSEGRTGRSSTSGYDSKYPGLGALEDSGGPQAGGLVLEAKFCGAQLLQWLHERRAHGEQLLRTVTLRLMWHVHQVFFNQLTHWMVHGMLLDGGSEFLIRPDPATVDNKEAEGPAAAAVGPDTDTVRDSNGGSGRALGVSSTDALDVAVMTEAETYKDFHSAFVVDNLQLPPGVSPHTASNIEFVGRAVRLLKSAPASAKLRQLQDSCGGQPLQQLLPYGDAMAYAAALRMLQDQAEFSPGALERTVEAIRADVASRLWQLVVVDSQLVDHLAALKDYMLLAKGDFYQCFLTDAGRLLTKPAFSMAVKDVALPWLSAASKSTAADDPCFKYFSLNVNRAAGQVQRELMQQEGPKLCSGSSKTAQEDSEVPATLAALSGEVPQLCECLCLDAQLPWPLGVLITRKHLDEYNKLFRLLLQVKRVQLDLEAAWQELGRLCGRKGGSMQPGEIGGLLQLRQHMGHLITNLQVYLQLDVVESSYDRLLQEVAAAQDFAAVAAAHGRFLETLTTQSLFHSPSMHALMHLAFGLSHRLCALVKGASEKKCVDLEEVQRVRDAFQPVVVQLCVNVGTSFMQKKGPYLNQLHERLDYNKYVSSYQSKYIKPTRQPGPSYRPSLKQPGSAPAAPAPSNTGAGRPQP